MQENKDQQLFFMRAAIREGEKGRNTAPPNPWVGCVLVKNGEIVGSGYHAQAGCPHAEAMALAEAKENARGSTAYVTLEPCAHHGRTPPCTTALIQAGVKRVVIPFLDPDPTSLSGFEQLKNAGIEVIIGIGKEEAELSLAPYLYHRRTGLPYCLLKTAISIDGCMAAPDGSSKWITGEMARKDARQFRAQSQAILIGVETAIQDKPTLSAEGKPLRVILDRKGRLPEEGALFDSTIAPTLIFTESNRVWKNAESCKAFSLKEILLELGRRGVMQLFVEGGATIHSQFMKENFVQEWVVYVGNCFLGNGKRMDLNITSIDLAPRFQLESVLKLCNDVRMIYKTSYTISKRGGG